MIHFSLSKAITFLIFWLKFKSRDDKWLTHLNNKEEGY